MKILTGAQMRELESHAINVIGIPSLILMENAAAKLAECCMERLAGDTRPRAAIIAGSGGNGGDGLALARHLWLKGVDVKVFLASAEITHPDAKANLEIARNMGVPVEADMREGARRFIGSAGLTVDALFGVGLNRHISEAHEYIINIVNNCAKYILSVDMPSGVNADSGEIMGAALKAGVTVALGFAKAGLMAYPGAGFAGEVRVADIGLPYPPGAELPPLAGAEISAYTDEDAKGRLPARPARSNKGTFGRVYGFAGSSGMTGAAFLSAAAAYRVGAGYVFACAVPEVAQVLRGGLKEALVCEVPEKNGRFCRESLECVMGGLDGADAVYIGPGIGRGAEVAEFVAAAVESITAPLILDADALNAIAENVEVLKKLKAPCIVTPHPGEMARLAGRPAGEILGGMIGAASEFSRKFNVTTLLKDARSVVASPDGQVYINMSGSPALAKAGSGDVLTGIVAGFAAQGLGAFEAAKLGAYIHGKAGESAGGSLSCYGVLASDLLVHAPLVLKRIASA